MKSKVLEGLNEVQQEAVAHTEGPLLIFAGAGSGKTKVLVHRIAYILEQKLARPAEILGVTFTNKAAREMIERVNLLLKSNSPLPWMGTFHSICVRILRIEGHHIGVKSNFVIYDDVDSLSLIKKIAKEQRVDDKKFGAKTVAGAISSAKNELMGPDDYADAAVGLFQEAVAKIYPAYQGALREANALDFDDLIGKAIELFQKNNDVLKLWGKRFKYILVDEYQDTNYAQYVLIKLLAEISKNLCVVGDEDQAIYSWRGADYRNIMNFKNDWADAKVVLLEQNYRSTKNIIDAASEVIAKNLNRSSKVLWTDSTDGEAIALYVADSEIEEAGFVISEAERLTRADIPLAEQAVLYRTHAQSRTFEEAAIAKGVPYQIIGGLRFYERREVKDIVAYLRLFATGGDYVSLKRVINVPSRGVGAKTFDKIEAAAKEAGDYVSGLRKVVNEPGIRSTARDNLSALANFIERGKGLIAEMSPAELIRIVVSETKYKKYLEAGSINAEERLENIEELVSASAKFDRGELSNFLEEVALISDADTAKGGEALTLMTVHAAKGLEFDTVFIPGFEEGIFPHSRSFFSEAELEEERRLCYVALTRAKRKLYLLNTSSRVTFGRVAASMPSRFISDIPENLIEEVSSGAVVSSAIGFRKGDLIRHDAFGVGKILGLEQDEALIQFEQGGKKRLALLMSPVTKVDPSELDF